MKLHFNKLETTNDTIQVSWDGGNTWSSFPVSSAKENGITFSETDYPNISLIKVKGKFTTVSDLDFVTTAKEDNSTSGGLEGLSLIDENGVFTGFKGNVIIPKGVTSIGNQAFYYCTELTDIVIPDGVTKIGQYAFCECSNLTSITIPESVTFIGNQAFRNCTSLTSIVIPEGVTKIGNDAFFSCRNLTEIEIPDSVTSIGDTAFQGCASLTSITITNNVTSIGYCAFWGCSNLATINFTGTEAQWNAISKGYQWNYNVPSNCVINYNYNKPK